tara:strand:- start:7774 stop:8709 length:936 start_codon:yes stop_codon:yes gene_type:complete
MNIDLNTIIRAIINQKRLFLKNLIVSIVISTLIFFIIPKKYSTSIHLLPDQVQNTSGFGAAIGILGLDSGSLSQNNEQFIKPDIVQELIRSRSFEKKLLQKTIIIDEIGTKKVILNYFKDTDNFEETFENNSKYIVQGFANVKKDIETGIYSITITTDNPYVSFHLCNAVYNTLTDHRAEILGSFNNEKNIFLNQKIKMVGKELKKAEKDLIDFVSKNSNYEKSPSLNLVYDTKSKNVNLLSNLFWKYRQDLEILELENISMIGGLVIVDKPFIDLDPIFPSSKIILTIFTLLSILINIPYVLYVDIYRKQ